MIANLNKCEKQKAQIGKAKTYYHFYLCT